MESNQLNSPKVFSHKGQSKDNHFETQMKRVFEAFKRKPSTMLMVSFETGILRAKGLCKVSKHRAGFYTANPELFPTSKQLNLF